LNYNKLFLILLVGSCFGKTKFTDQQVASMIPRYFARDHNSPPLNRVRIYGENGKKVFHLEISINRTRYEGQIEYVLGAMASVCRYANRPFDKFIIITEPNNRQQDSEIIESKARCTIDYFVFNRVKADRWKKDCISISSN
tara:strand:- start:195 stop:617 length:423 start_codon:yes stop_codon:yes gene_type:complete